MLFRSLPHQLVEAFQSTLEEVTFADLIVQVTDISDPEFKLQVDIVEKQLEALDADAKPRIHVFNKVEKVDPSLVEQIKGTNRHAIKQIFASALYGNGIEELRQAIIEVPQATMLPFRLVVPYDKSNIISELQKIAVVDQLEYQDEGAEIVFKIRKNDLGIITPLLNNK